MTEVLRGPDVSAFQGAAINWQAVKSAGASFAFCKASEGVGYKDATFDFNWTSIRDAGLIRGCYNFARPDLGNTPTAEADWFLHCVGALQVGDIIALDIEAEAPNVDVAGWSLEWLRHVEQVAGFPPLLYTYLAYGQARLQDARLAHNPLWLALYEQPLPAAVPPWTEVAIHQHTDHASYPGIPGPCDESVVARSVDQLRALGKPASAEKPAEKRTPAPVTHRVRMVTTQWLRALPRADSARLVECTAGEVFGVIGPPTMHWTHVTAHGQRGWLLSSNVERVD